MSETKTINLHDSWFNVIGDEFDKDYMQSLKAFLKAEKAQGKVIYPHSQHWFNALDTTPFEQVKVVVLGQDPYHGPGQAHGLSFSVPEGVKIPPSLRNIYKELVDDIGITMPQHGNLQVWAEQGVLLLNATLTVEQANAGSHQNKGWETFTDAVIAALNEQREGIVFLLWGSYAQKKGRIIDTNKHLVLKAPHPSPLSAHRGFLGCKHFSQVNDYLLKQGFQAIDWQP